MIAGRNKQNGFSAVEIILIIVVVALLGVGGWYVFQNQNKPADTTTNTSQNDQPQEQKTDEQPADPNEGYLVIKEWGVKLKMKEAAKVTYTFDGVSYSGVHGTSESSIRLAVKPEYLQDKTCEVSVGMSRYTAANIEPALIDSAIKIGEFYYLGGGSPYACDDERDNELNKSVRADFDYTKLQSL